jgi:mono/diheme cytochrome c family protein
MPDVRRLAVAALAAGLAACSLLPKPPTVAAQAVSRGHELARRACGGCHAVEPGGGTSAAARAPAFASLEMRHTASLDGRVAEIVRGGHYAMPPVKLSTGEVADLTGYIASLRPR